MKKSGVAAREFEIKLEIPAQTVGKVMRLPWLWELASGEMNASSIQSTYYDTPKCELLERGVTLRVRKVGAMRLQTIKAAANGAALPIERGEWEEEISGDEPVLKLAAGTPLDAMSRKKLRRRLAPYFEIHVDRSAFPIQSANSDIEIAIDRAHIVGEQAASFCEIELELKRGASSEMARIARRIAAEVPAALSLKTKAERGYELRQGRDAQPHIGEAITISPATRVGEALQTIGWSCLRHFALNKQAVEAQRTEAVHQMRTGLNRLSAAIAVFSQLVDGPETDAVQTELKWLAGELAPACELDNLLQRTLTPLRESEADVAALDALRGEVLARLQLALERAQHAVTSDRFRQFVLRTALWLIAAEWSDAPSLSLAHPSRRIRAFAASALTAHTAPLAKALRKFAGHSLEGFAELHARLETIEHAAGFFGDLFPRTPRGRRAFARLLKRLLRDLTRLGDLAANERLRDAFMADWTSEAAATHADTAPKAYAMGYALGHQALEKEARIGAVGRAAAKLATLNPFWR